MLKNRKSQLISSAIGLLLACGMGLNASAANGADIKNGKFDIQYFSGPLEGKISTGLFQYEELPSIYDGLQIVKIDHGLILVKFDLEKQEVTHEDVLHYPYLPQIRFIDGSPVGLELQLGEGNLTVSDNIIINSMDLSFDNKISYSTKDYENEAKISFGEGEVNNIQIIGVLIGAGVLVFAVLKMASLVKKKMENDSDDMAIREEHNFSFKMP